MRCPVLLVPLLQVMYARQHERQAMKDALEMAVLTTVSHPNIIQVYNCFTDMVEDAGGWTVQRWYTWFRWSLCWQAGGMCGLLWNIEQWPLDESI